MIDFPCRKFIEFSCIQKTKSFFDKMAKDKDDYKKERSDRIETDLNELKEQYEVLRKKYGLPSFSELNVLFEIEEIDINTEFLLRKIRRAVYEKLMNYTRFIEVILNPTNASLFFFKLIKRLDSDDLEELSQIYDSLGKFEIEIVKLDLDYDEKDEAEFVQKAFGIFNEELRKKLLSVINKISKDAEDLKRKNNGSYFG